MRAYDMYFTYGMHLLRFIHKVDYICSFTTYLYI